MIVDGWTSLARRVGATAGDDEVRKVGVDLLRRWNEPHRHYHNEQHLDAILARLDELHSADLPRVGAWFHDAIYNPRRADNEAASAAFALDALGGLGLEDRSAGEVARLVQLTRTHDPASRDTDGQVLCDADLAILGVEPNAYDAYAAAIRREYAHVSDADFRAGRSQVLRGLLARPAVFTTAYGRERWEAPARRNLERELGALQPGPPD